MYLAHIPFLNYHIFTVDDPRIDGYEGPILAGVTFDLPDGVKTLDELYRWPKGADAPDTCLGRDPAASSRFKVFRGSAACRRDGFIPLGPNFSLCASWSEVAEVARTAIPAQTSLTSE